MALPEFDEFCKATASERSRADAARVFSAWGQSIIPGNLRADAGETMVFARQLEYVKAQVYEVRYLDLLVRTLIPVDNSVPTGAQSFVWRVWDRMGMAKIIANYADDLPKVTMLGKENVQGIKSLGVSYDYSIQDVRSAAMAGIALEAEKAKTARRMVENKIEKLAALGDAAADLPGMLNNANVPLIDNTTIHGDWTNAATTGAQIFSDLNIMGNRIPINTKQIFKPDTLLLPTNAYIRASSEPYSIYSAESVLSTWMRTNPVGIRTVIPWHMLDTADAAGTNGRAVVYKRDPEVIELIIPQEFEQLPPQPRNLAFDVPCHARIGGVSIKQPYGMLYVDDVQNA